MTGNRSQLALFVGPTLQGVDLSEIDMSGAEILPPARRGDIQRFMAGRVPDMHLAIVDGIFHTYPAVGHVEIRSAIRSGWSIWGLSSMGAIRAAEMRDIGMKGFGEVYRQYVEDPTFDDDEVALLHAEEPPYSPITEPLIHVRSLVSEMLELGKLTSVQATRVIERLKNRWFGERTLPQLRLELKSVGVSAAIVDEALLALPRHRVKSADLQAFLSKRLWCCH
jgi:hypothetical protein